MGTKRLSVTKSPAMMLREPSPEPGICSLTQLSSIGYVDITRSFRDSVGWVQMYFKSSVRLIPATKKPPETKHRGWTAGGKYDFSSPVWHYEWSVGYLAFCLVSCVQTPRSEPRLCICWPTSKECGTTAHCDSVPCCAAHRTRSPGSPKPTGFEELMPPETDNIKASISESHTSVEAELSRSNDCFSSFKSTPSGLGQARKATDQNVFGYFFSHIQNISYRVWLTGLCVASA